MLIDPVDQAAHSTQQWHLIRKETLINTVATVVIAIALTWLVFHGREIITVFDSPPYGLFGLLPGTFNFTFLVTLALTFVTRNRVRRGQVSPFAADRMSQFAKYLPANALLRALLLAVCAVLLLAPLTVAIVWMSIRTGLLPAQWSFAGIATLFVLHFVMLSLIVTPIVVWRALHDR